MKYYIIAGEASGDLHGSNLVKAVKQHDPLANFKGWGGDMMQAAGVTIVRHIRDLAFMGFAEVLMNIRTILSNLSFCKKDIEAFAPDVLILVDYPGFNLRIAEWAKSRNIKTVFYISPQVWAWKEGRVKKMKKTIDKMIVILPFEKEYYASRWQWDVEYVGHPLLDVIDNLPAPSRSLSPKPIIALLPGSRKQEINIKLPIMLEVAKHFPDYQFIVAKAPALDDALYQTYMAGYNNVSTVQGKTYDLLLQTKAALVTSGTATLETALCRVPQVVCYKGSKISFWIAKRLIDIKYISLVNLIMDKEVVKELIQDDLSVTNLVTELNSLLNDEDRQRQVTNDYLTLRQKLQAGGNASYNAARIIVEFLEKQE